MNSLSLILTNAKMIQSSKNGKMFRLLFLIDFLSNQGTIHERRVYSYMDMLGEVGGLTDSLLYIFRLLYFLLTPSSLMLELVKDFYSYRPRSNGFRIRKLEVFASKLSKC